MRGHDFTALSVGLHDVVVVVCCCGVFNPKKSEIWSQSKTTTCKQRASDNASRYLSYTA